MKPLHVTHFTRKPDCGAFSIERVFRDVREVLSAEIDVHVRTNTYLSKGIIPRLKDSWAAKRAAGDINHVLGDTHYLTYFLPKQKTILTVHDTELVDRSRGLKRIVLWFFWYWLPIKRSAKVTTISEESKRRLLSLARIDSSKVEVIPNPVSSTFKQSPSLPRQGSFRILHIGVKPNKNLERLLRALQGLDVELTIVGKLNTKQQALVRACVPNHRLTANLSEEELQTEYARSEALAFLSLSEGFGLPIIEAQASGRAVLTSDREPMNKVAADAALLVDPESEAEIRNAVVKLSTDEQLRNDLVLRGLRNVDRFSATAVASLYSQLYQRVLDQEQNV